MTTPMNAAPTTRRSAASRSCRRDGRRRRGPRRGRWPARAGRARAGTPRPSRPWPFRPAALGSRCVMAATRAPYRAPRPAAPTPGRPLHDRHDERETAPAPLPRCRVTQRRAGTVVVGHQARHHAAHREHPERAAQQPAVADAHHAAARRDPQEHEPAGRPLDEDGRQIEMHHRPASRSADDRKVTRGVG